MKCSSNQVKADALGESNFVVEVVDCPLEPVTHEPGAHYFGYYDKCPWSGSGRWLATLAPSQVDREPASGEPLALGVVDLHNGNRYTQLSQTTAWNWQQGCMLRWLPTAADTLMFNDFVDGKLVTMALEPATGERRVYADCPTYDISDGGKWIASLNFSRVARCRPGYGYNDGKPAVISVNQPDDDGVFLYNTTTKKSELVVTIAAAASVGNRKPGASDRVWFNHLKFSPNAKHLLFLHRWAPAECRGHLGFSTRVMVLDVASGKIRCVSEDCGASHFDWFDDDNLMIFLYREEGHGPGYYLINVVTGALIWAGENLLPVDGHCVYNPDRTWLVTDTYPQGPGRLQTLMLYHVRTGRRVEVGKFPAIEVSDPSLRCDLHARWSRDGRQLCFDSTHTSSRQMHVMDVSQIVQPR